MSRCKDDAHERDELDKERRHLWKEMGEYVEQNDLKEYATCSAADLRVGRTLILMARWMARSSRKLYSHYADWEVRFGQTRNSRQLSLLPRDGAGTCLGVMSVPSAQRHYGTTCVLWMKPHCDANGGAGSNVSGRNRQLSPFRIWNGRR